MIYATRLSESTWEAVGYTGVTPVVWVQGPTEAAALARCRAALASRRVEEAVNTVLDERNYPPDERSKP